MPVDRMQPYLITNMSSNARRALTLLFFSLLDTTLVFFIFGSPEGYNSHEVMFY